MGQWAYLLFGAIILINNNSCMYIYVFICDIFVLYS